MKFAGKTLLALLFGIALTAAAGAMDYVVTSENATSTPWARVVAEGTITDYEAELFLQAFREEVSYSEILSAGDGSVSVSIASDGGSLTGAIALGRELRKLNAQVYIGRLYDEPGNLYWQLAPGDCLGACVFAVLGGTSRELVEGSRMAVSQIVSPQGFPDDVAAFTGLEVSDFQVLYGLLLEYALAMGAKADLVVLAAKSQAYHWLTIEEARTMRVIFDPYEVAPWELEARGESLIAVSRSSLHGETAMGIWCERQASGGQRYLSIVVEGGNGAAGGPFAEWLTGVSIDVGSDDTAEQEQVFVELDQLQVTRNGERYQVIAPLSDEVAEMIEQAEPQDYLYVTLEENAPTSAALWSGAFGAVNSVVPALNYCR